MINLIKSIVFWLFITIMVGMVIFAKYGNNIVENISKLCLSSLEYKKEKSKIYPEQQGRVRISKKRKIFVIISSCLAIIPVCLTVYFPENSKRMWIWCAYGYTVSMLSILFND